MIDTRCNNCGREITISSTNPDNFDPTNGMPICDDCFDKEFSKRALREKKLQSVLSLGRLVNKKWWQFWK